MLSLNKIKEIIEKNNFDFKKMFGQNFIIDYNIIQNIVKKADIKEDSLVIEIGPGAGSLTCELASVAKQVLCFEIDVKLKPILDETLKDYDNVDIIFEDFLKVDLQNILKKYSYKNLYVVANLPYYITTPIIMKFIENRISLEKMVVMVQKEVGNRFKAKPGSKDYSSLSIFLDYYFDVQKIMDVSRNVFIPKPNVDSIVISFNKKTCQYKVLDEKVFFKLVKDAFKQKRKTIRNNLKQYDLNVIEKVLKKHEYDLTVRAEQLSIDIFIEISNELTKNI